MQKRLFGTPSRMRQIWGGYDDQAPSNYKALLQIIVSLIGLFCKRDV